MPNQITAGQIIIIIIITDNEGLQQKLTGLEQSMLLKQKLYEGREARGGGGEGE